MTTALASNSNCLNTTNIEHSKVKIILYLITRNSTECRRTFDEALKLFLTDSFGFHLDLQGHEDGEEELVGLVETSRGVRESEIRQVLNDVLDASRRERRPVGARHGDVEELQELAK